MCSYVLVHVCVCACVCVCVFVCVYTCVILSCTYVCVSEQIQVALLYLFCVDVFILAFFGSS